MPPIFPRLRSLLVAAALGLTSLAPAGCNPGGADAPSKADCELMRAHVIDLQLAREAKPADKHRAAEVAKHRRIRLAANASAAIARCQRDLSDDDVACALRASSLQQYRACAQR